MVSERRREPLSPPSLVEADLAVAERPAAPASDAVPASGGDGRSAVLRGGLLTLVGAAYAAASGFALTVAVGRTFGAHEAGLFFIAVAVFMILNGVVLLGSDTGMVRALSAARATRNHADVWQVFRATVGPVLGWSVAVAAVLALLAEPLARVLVPDDVAEGTHDLRVLAVTLVLSGVGQACLNGTRSFGGPWRFVVLYQLWLPTSRLGLVLLLAATGLDRDWLLWSWVLPLLVMDAVALAWVGRAARRESRVPGRPAREPGEVLREVWHFNLPRGLASLLEIGIVWVDVLLVGLFLGPAAAGAYAAASRLITSGTMAMEALRIATAPQLAEASARGERHRVQELHALTSVWLVLLSWPMFLTLAAFAPLALSAMGPEFVDAAPAMTVMALSILGYLALGNINSVLLMAGLSRVTAGNTSLALAVNVALNLVLVPTVGMVGAAIAWAAALTLDSGLCTVRGRRRLEVHPPGRPLVLAAGAALAAFGLPALLVRLLAEPTLPWFVGYASVATACYAALLVRLRVPLRLDGLRALIRRPR